MNWFQILVVAVLSVYTLFIFMPVFILLFEKHEDTTQLRGFIPDEKVSIIVPFRNENTTIINCLEGIAEQEFPKELMEVILVDDNSEDNGKQLAETFLKEKQVPFKLIDLKEKNLSGKKTAIEEAVTQASGNIIITRDADTYTQNNLWLKSVAFYFKNTNTNLLIPPVILAGTSLIQAFQQFENMAITCVGYAFAKIKLPFVCSGANLAFKKDSFLKADPYKDNKRIASGDDMFLLQSFIKKHFLITAVKNNNILVYTNAEVSFKSFINQRIRWASKAKDIKINAAKGIATLLFLTNLMLLICLSSCSFSSPNSTFCLFALLYKCLIDFLLLFLGVFMFKQKLNFIFYLPAFIANLFYIPIVSIASISIKPSWKGRKISV